MLPLTPDELLSTTRAVRKRLDFDRPVDRSLVQECIALAFQAPTGSNRQGWHFVIVEDQAKKDAIAELYGRAFDGYTTGPRPQYDAGDIRAKRAEAVTDSAVHLRRNFARSPYLVIPCLERREPAGGGETSTASYWGSLLPAFWSFMLAARSRGLGTAWTTLHLHFEREAAEVLGIPFERFAQGGLSPLAHTIGTDFKPGPRVDAAQLTHWDSW